MTKFLLLVITGPAFAFAIQNDELGEPRVCRSCKTLAYVKGMTLIGMPCMN